MVTFNDCYQTRGILDVFSHREKLLINFRFNLHPTESRL